LLNKNVKIQRQNITLIKRLNIYSSTIDKLLTWMCILMTAFPISVAPKNVPNGTRKWPQVMPARSNKGLGICNSHQHTIQVNSALHPSGVAKSSTSFGWGKGGNFTSVGLQVTLCDLMWHVSSRSGVATLQTAIHLLLTYLLYLQQFTHQASKATIKVYRVNIKTDNDDKIMTKSLSWSMVIFDTKFVIDYNCTVTGMSH